MIHPREDRLPGPRPTSRGSLSPKMLDNSSLAAAVASGGLPEGWRERKELAGRLFGRVVG